MNRTRVMTTTPLTGGPARSDSAHIRPQIAWRETAWREADRLMLCVLVVQAVVAIAIGLQWGDSPLALGVSLPILAVAVLVQARMGGSTFCAHTMAVATMLMVALHIQLARGTLEYHFGVFVSLAFLLVYRHWGPIVTGAAVIAVHHILFDRLQFSGMDVYCLTEPNFNRVLLHAGYVIAQTAFQVLIAIRMQQRAVEQVELVGLVEQLTADDQIHLDTSGKRFAAGTTSARLKEALDRMHGAVREVQAATHSITQTSVEIASGNLDLSTRTEETASNLQQTAEAMAQLTEGIGQTATSAREANDLAATASRAATKGGEVVAEVVATMQAIDTSASKIAEITSLIDSIAFQTNILALNAAVEAARAGEQGRGFAVVASEVRSLAQRSASAAKDIKTLIQQSTQEVADGAKHVQAAGTSMKEIEDAVQRVVALIGGIASASAQQSGEVARANQAISQLDQMTQQNAALVEQSSAAADSMKEQANRLSQSTSVFNT
jgi:methyl-accepting chemotaxis protein